MNFWHQACFALCTNAVVFVNLGIFKFRIAIIMGCEIETNWKNSEKSNPDGNSNCFHFLYDLSFAIFQRRIPPFFGVGRVEGGSLKIMIAAANPPGPFPLPPLSVANIKKALRHKRKMQVWGEERERGNRRLP